MGDSRAAASEESRAEEKNDVVVLRIDTETVVVKKIENELEANEALHFVRATFAEREPIDKHVLPESYRASKINLPYEDRLIPEGISVFAKHGEQIVGAAICIDMMKSSGSLALQEPEAYRSIGLGDYVDMWKRLKEEWLKYVGKKRAGNVIDLDSATAEIRLGMYAYFDALAVDKKYARTGIALALSELSCRLMKERKYKGAVSMTTSGFSFRLAVDKLGFQCLAGEEYGSLPVFHELKGTGHTHLSVIHKDFEEGGRVSRL